MSKLETQSDRTEGDEKKAPAVEYMHTTNIPSFFESLGLSLMVSTYQAQRIMTLAPNGPKLQMLMRVMPRPTGIALAPDRMAVCCKDMIWFFARAYDLRNPEGQILPYDFCFTPRHAHVTGDIAAHQAAWGKDGLVVVNTRFSCLCTINEEWSFTPIWKPRFISKIIAEDRCHLNGVAMDKGVPVYVSALGESDEEGGWRKNKTKGGCIIDVASGEVVTRGLCMPHSPTLYAGKLWVLESGTGELQTVDPKSGARTTVIHLPGYLRGLAFFDRFAFVGLCKIREKSTFGGLPVEEKYRELPCAIHIIDLQSGANVGMIHFTKGIEELFDIHVMPGVRQPHVIGFEEDTIAGLYIMPNN